MSTKWPTRETRLNDRFVARWIGRVAGFPIKSRVKMAWFCLTDERVVGLVMWEDAP